ncbi:MAG: hypothetical protein JNN00_08350 [Chitinophagaceae bacterium]|nr:hypothetical protein [Chitinophagaceae bacterium]
MKEIFFITTMLCSSFLSFAQPTDQQRIEDSVIGWKQIYSFKGKQYKTLAVEGQTYSAYQQSISDSFTTWIQRTFLPIGAWGDIFPKNFTTRQNKGPVPQGIGMDALIYALFKNDRTRKYEMIPNESHVDVSIYTNALAGINPVHLFNSPDGFFFSMPKENYASTFTDKSVMDAVKEFGLHEGDRFSRYMVYFPSQMGVTVVLTPDNQLPIVQLSKGEVLEQCEKGLLREVEERKKEARHMSSNNPSYYAGIIKDLDEKFYPQCIRNLNAVREKYKSKLTEPAVLYYFTGPSFSDFTSTSSLPTIFIEDWYQKISGYPVYRYRKEAIENSKKDKPLWISISWQPKKPNTGVQAYEVHRAMLRYFNYDYVYNYFFNPEKVKGVSYSPSNADEQAARIKQLKTHWVKEEKQLPQGTFFADDFSDNAEGNRPKGWNDTKSRTPATVVSVKTKPGKWVQLGYMNALSPATSLTRPLPENFTLDFDMVTDEFNARTGGSVKLSLSSFPTTPEGWAVPNSKGTTIEWYITAGNESDYNNNNYRGESKPIINSTVASHNGNFNYTYDLREFTNKKTTVHATLKVKNGQPAFFINGKQIAVPSDMKQDYCKDCACKGIPPGTMFRNLNFTNTTHNWSPDGKSNEVHVYISNVKITKE